MLTFKLAPEMQVNAVKAAALVVELFFYSTLSSAIGWMKPAAIKLFMHWCLVLGIML